MVNYLHSLFNRPERGWDPISPEYAAQYSEAEWKQGVNEVLLDELDRWVGGLEGRRVLDLGGGPGQYSVALARRKAIVTWHDISNTYREIAQKKAAEAGVQISFGIGYMDDAAKLYKEPFDLVFSRICWYYCFRDRNFAKVFFKLLKPGGIGYVDTMHSGTWDSNASWPVRVRTWLNNRFGIKIGHPLPPHGRIAGLFMSQPIAKICVDYSLWTNDRVLFMKQRGPG
jgi:2-polyprenyl-3-methyl-5-hydroxy-6-metoxy-1,4-benzoquinol methylase